MRAQGLGLVIRGQKEIRDRWCEAVLVNDEGSTDSELYRIFTTGGFTPAEASEAIAQRENALRDPLRFRLEM